MTAHVSFELILHSRALEILLAGHKCGFAAAEKNPCPQHEFNSYFNQTTCQKCDIGLGEKCHKWEKDSNQPIIGRSRIMDVLGLSLNRK